MPVRPTDTHRMMIQTFMSRRHIPDEVAQELYKRCITAVKKLEPSYAPVHQANRTGTRAFIQECSSMLEEEVRMEIRVVGDEDRQGKDVFVLINTDGSDDSKAMSDYEALQISYFREVVDAIITSYPANSIGSNAARNLTSKLKGTMLKSVAENLLKSFVARGWLSISRRSRYSLAPRAIAELEGWLAAEYEDYIQKCARCAKTVFSGVICTSGDCDAHIHGSCYKILQEGRNAAAKCPTCRETFDDFPPNALGEKAVSNAEDNFGTIRGKRKRPSGRRSEVVDEDIEVQLGLRDEEEDDDLEYADP